MRRIKVDRVREVVEELCLEANTVLRKDVLGALEASIKREPNRLAQKVLDMILQNACVAAKEGLPICQDTGLPLVFVVVGQEVQIVGGDLAQAIDQGIRSGYKKWHLRSSIVDDPLKGSLLPTHGPGILHFELVRGSRMKVTVMPRGFGCESKGQVRVFRPTAGPGEIKAFVVEVVREAGPDACPPFVVGVGIGGTQGEALQLAKRALLRPVGGRHPKKHIAKLEEELFEQINRTNLGPMGLGGRTTALGVSILTQPTHIAGLPVAVDISCHALRSATRTI